MRVCVVGGGGREHALGLALAQTADVVACPGNPGMAAAGITCTPAPPEEVVADLVVVGPEAPLVAGLADRLRAKGRLVVGPGADGARLEGSKAWMKQVLVEAGVPTAGHVVFTEEEAARAHLRRQTPPYVIKTDGLAAGKGVLVTWSLEEAEDDVSAKLAGRAFGDAGRRVVVEEGLVGRELSLLALCDGRRALPLVPAQDFKRLGEADTGPNTGGMGAYSPVPGVGADLVGQVMDRVVEPLVAALRRRGIDYRGVVYAGLMLTPEGPKVIEINVRLGDPEAQVVIPRLAPHVDLADLLAGVAAGDLPPVPDSGAEACVAVVLAAPGYPLSPRFGDPIAGVADAEAVEGVAVLHAGTALDDRGRLVTAGGRVLNVCALGATLGAARERAYRAASLVSWPGVQYRGDIALAAADEGNRS
ncbi:MAG TPA: phosphoribosylamine--glycine ligase [Acidimicrobiales bacterium]|nr:phosphoribosylamine--glycine ligase [Acidimicrobiales bacterium]